jgi:hypothetical protein
VRRARSGGGAPPAGEVQQRRGDQNQHQRPQGVLPGRLAAVGDPDDPDDQPDRAVA